MLTQTAMRNGSRGQPAMQSRRALVPRAAMQAGTIELMGACMSFAANAEIYKVVSGTVRTYKVLVDGRRQIGAFHLAGDIFGLETGDVHTFSAEAITDCKIIVFKRGTVMALAARDNDVARQMWELTARELARVQEHSLVLIKSAEERVAGFLLEMAERVPSGGAVDLPMSRQDIADYLGLTIETVSRTLKHLENAAAIEVPKRRRILLRDRSALRRLNA